MIQGAPIDANQQKIKEMLMLKYLFAWLIGVPLGILVLIWLVSHFF